MRIPYESCPLCSGARLEFLRAASCTAHPLYDERLPPIMRWLRCADCAHVFVDGHLSAEGERILLARANPNQVPRWSFDHNERLISARIVKWVAERRRELSGRWLDVGFGNASLVTTADEFGFEAVGIDAREESVLALRKMGYQAHCVSLAELEAAPFDVISMADVLEHMAFPKASLAAAHRLLSPGGLLFLSMPNMDCFSWRARDELSSNPYWGELEHLHNFGRKRLYALLEECGFEPCAYGVNERYFVGMEVIAKKRAV